MPTERPQPQKPTPRTKPTFKFRGEDYTFHLGVKGWILAQEHFAARGTAPATPAYIVDTYIIPGDIRAASAILKIAFGIATPDLEWSDDEIGEVIEEVGMHEVVQLIVKDLAWVMFPEAMTADEIAEAEKQVERSMPRAGRVRAKGAG